MSDYRRRTEAEAESIREAYGLRRAYPVVTGKPHIFTYHGRQWTCSLERGHWHMDPRR